MQLAEQELDQLQTQIAKGPIQFTVAVSPRNPRLSDEITLTLTMEYEEGIKVIMPPFGESLGEFLLLDFHQPLPQVRDGRHIQQQIYKIEPTQSGELVIPPIPINFEDHREGESGKVYTIESEALPVKIVSLVGDQAPELAALVGARGPMPLPPSHDFPLWLVGAVAMVLLLGFVWLFARHKKRQILTTPLNPKQQAELELQEVLQADFIARREYAAFYSGITGVVRRFIERSKGIRAPEQTTLEFLHAMQQSDKFDQTQRAQLQDFLEAADLVKFAAQKPSAQDVNKGLERTREFIDIQAITKQTREVRV